MATTRPLVNYFNRDFAQLRADLMNYAKTYHSDKFAYFNDASPDMMYLELLAYIGDTLNYSIDRAFNESFRNTAQSRESFIRIAQDLGFYNFYPKPSTTQAVISVTVPAIATADGSMLTPDSNYFVALYSGLKVEASNGTIFECLDEINFSDANNRKIIPNFDTNNRLIDYTIQKTIVLYAGETRTQRFYISDQNIKPFLEVAIRDEEVTEIIGVVVLPGDVYESPEDAAFRDLDNVYLEVENLSDDKIFVDVNPLSQEYQSLVNLYGDMTINYGEWVNKPKRFIVRRNKDNQAILTFGSNLINYDNWNQILSTYDVRDLANFSLSQILNNMALGEVPPVNSTLFIRYRTGAGTKTNILSNQFTNILEKQFVSAPTSANLSILNVVRNSLIIETNLPAAGGSDEMTNEEIKHSTGKIFAANDRAVTYEDVKNLILNMPAKYGKPFRISYEEIKPQVVSYSQVKNYLDSKLNELLITITPLERETRINEIKSFIDSLPSSVASVDTGSVVNTYESVSNTILQNTTSLWIGEKCRLHILTIDQDNIPLTAYKDTNGIWQSPNIILKNNIKNWLKEKRLIGDWIDVVDARVVNFQVYFKILADKRNKQKVLVDCLTTLRDYFNVNNWQINQPIFIANVSTILQEIDGVVNVVDLKFYNIFDKDIESGKVYSPKELGRYRNNKTVALNSYNNKYEMENVNNVILSYPDTLLNVRYPELDIIGAVV